MSVFRFLLNRRFLGVFFVFFPLLMRTLLVIPWSLFSRALVPSPEPQDLYWYLRSLMWWSFQRWNNWLSIYTVPPSSHCNLRKGERIKQDGSQGPQRTRKGDLLCTSSHTLVLTSMPSHSFGEQFCTGFDLLQADSTSMHVHLALPSVFAPGLLWCLWQPAQHSCMRNTEIWGQLTANGANLR